MGSFMSRKLEPEALRKEDIEELHRSVKTDDDIETAIKKLLEVMTLQEKLGQLQQISYGDKGVTPSIEALITQGGVGSFLNCYDLATINQIQQIAVEKSRLKIPMLIGRDVIHGYRTIFPIPLAQAASFDTALVEKCARAAAVEASACGIRWTFSPMVDIARDPRWGAHCRRSRRGPALGWADRRGNGAWLPDQRLEGHHGHCGVREALRGLRSN